MIRFASTLGAVIMAAAPFIIDTDIGKGMAILGLALLTIQAQHLRAWNLVALNIVSMAGFAYALLG